MAILIRNGLVLTEAHAEPTTADILVEADRITRVESSLEPRPDTRIIDASNQLVMPGLVNAHTHTHNVPSKAALDGLPLEIWLQYRMARTLNLSPREIYVSAAVNAIEMVKTGTTCACEMAQVLPYPTDEALDAVGQAYTDVGLRASIAAQVADRSFLEGLPGIESLLPEDILTQLKSRPPFPREETLATIRRAVDRWHGAAEGRIRFGVGPSSVTNCSDEFLEGCAQLSRERGVTVQTHLCETKAGARAALLRYGKSAAARLHELGLLGPRTILAHSIWVDDHDIDLIAETRSSVAHNPISNLKLGDGIAPVLKMRARGCNVALGTDGSASSDNQNLFGPLRVAAILHRVVDPNYDRWLSGADVLDMATANGARAAGFEGQTGGISPGKKADLVLLDLRSIYYHPQNDLVCHVVHCEVGSSVTTVLVDGRVIVESGKVTTVDEAALLAEADEIARRVSSIMEDPTGLARRIAPYVRQIWIAATSGAWQPNQYASEAYRDLTDP